MKVTDVASLTLSEPGSGSKDSDGVIDEMLVNFIARTRAQRPQVAVFVQDCCALQRNQYMTQQMQMLVDHKFCEVAICIYHQERHSKDDSDKDFGSLETALAHTVSFSVDCIGRVGQQLPRHADGAKKNAVRIMNPAAGTHWAGHQSARYNPVIGLSQSTGCRHVLVAAAPQALERLSRAEVQICRHGRTTSTSIHAEVAKLIGADGAKPALAPGEMRLFDFPPAIIAVSPDDEMRLDVDAVDAPDRQSATERQRVQLPPQTPLKSTSVDVLLWREAASFVPLSGRRQAKAAKAAKNAAALETLQASASAAATAGQALGGDVDEPVQRKRKITFKEDGLVTNTIQTLGPNCCLQQVWFAADMSDQLKRLLFVEGLVTADMKHIAEEKLYICRRRNYITRAADEVGQHATLPIMATFNDLPQDDGRFQFVADVPASPGHPAANTAFYIAPNDCGGFYSTGEHSAVARFNTANANVAHVALFRELFALACDQNGAPLNAESVHQPTTEQVKRHKSRLRAVKAARGPSQVTAYGMWARQYRVTHDHGPASGEWAQQPASVKTHFSNIAATANKSALEEAEVERATASVVPDSVSTVSSTAAEVAVEEHAEGYSAAGTSAIASTASTTAAPSPNYTKYCEDCGLRSRNYALPDDLSRRRWCGPCAKKHRAILPPRKKRNVTSADI
eukprot:SAG31_NODE_2806_length_5066_cov_8.018321_4_plen_681_part_00